MVAAALRADRGGFAGRMVRPALAAMVAVIGASAQAADSASSASSLYSAKVIVTGRDNLAERERGIREALPLVVTKVAADPAIGDRALSQGWEAKAAGLVEAFDYVDRKAGIQISDEQGTRERSFILTVRFVPAAIDSAVRQLGGEPWTESRPTVDVALEIQDGGSPYRLTETSEKGYGQRLALHDEADKVGLPVTIGAQGTSNYRLEGLMTITPAGYWNTSWTLTGPSLDERFGFENTTFDAAIARALGRSAKALAKR